MDEKRISFPGGFACYYLTTEEETGRMYSEIFLLKSFKKYGIEIKRGDCIFDIGANIGLFSLFATREDDCLSLFAYEPSQDAFRVLKRNLTLHGASNVKSFNLALGSVTGRTISTEIAEHGLEKIDLLRLDASGAELDILEGIENEDWAKIGQIMIEVNEMNNRVSRLTALLEKHHYDVTCKKYMENEESGALYNLYARRVDKLSLMGEELKVLERV